MNKLCFIDLETTGTDPDRHGIVQIAGQIRVGDKEEKFKIRARAFKDDVIDADAIAANGLNPQEGCNPHTAYAELIGVLSRYVDKFNKRDKFFFIGFNAKFDNEFLRKFFEKCGDKFFGSWFWFPYIDLMTISLVPLLSRRPGMENFKLATVCRTLGVPFDLEKAHDAEYDIQKTAELFDKLKICKSNTNPGTASI